MWLCQSILFQHQLQKENGDHTFRLSGTAYITSSLLYNKVTDTNASALLRNFTYTINKENRHIFFEGGIAMKKWKKILISLITVFVLAMLPAESAICPCTVCVTEAAPRISSSRLRQILTQKDASELANDTLDMAVPYWADLLKGSGITLRSLGFSTTK